MPIKKHIAAAIFILASTSSMFAKGPAVVKTVPTQVDSCTVTLPKIEAPVEVLPNLPAPEWQSLFAEDDGDPIGVAALRHLVIQVGQ